MNLKNTKYLFKKYSKLFKGRKEPISQNLMAFGFDCNDGWFSLLDELCNKIYSYCKKNKLTIPKVLQVKEKFGSLRFYVDSDSDNYIENLINEYEIKSSNTCEFCGNKGNIKKVKGWFMCRCDTCLK